MFNFNKPKQDLDNAIKTCPTCLGSGITTDFINEQFVTIPCTNPNCPTKEKHQRDAENMIKGLENVTGDEPVKIRKFNKEKESKTEQFKNTKNKIPIHFITQDMAEEVLEMGKVMQAGEKKYPERMSWTKAPITDWFGAAERHLNAYARGEEIDTESGCSHLAHVAVNCLIIDYLRKKKDNG